MPEVCSECERLWRVHSDAVRAHTAVVYRCHQARINGDLTAQESIKPIEQLAAGARRRTRKAAIDHEGTHDNKNRSVGA